jgi:hypothetical protein
MKSRHQAKGISALHEPSHQEYLEWGICVAEHAPVEAEWDIYAVEGGLSHGIGGRGREAMAEIANKSIGFNSTNLMGSLL